MDVMISWFFIFHDWNLNHVPLCVCKIDSEDWEVWHSRGLCYMHLKQFERALEAFEQANSISRHDSTFLHMGKVITSLNVQRREL